jgi:hypothetical protein
VPRACTIEPVGRESWAELAPRFLDHNYFQTWAVAVALCWRRRAACERVAVVRGGEVLGLASVALRRLPWLGVGIASVSCGPLTRRGRRDDLDRLEECLEQLRLEYAVRRGLLLRVLAPLGSPAWNINAADAFAHAGLVPSNRPRHRETFLLDIDRPHEAILAESARSWRRSLRRGQRRFTVRLSAEAPDIAALGAVHDPCTGLDADLCARLQEDLEPDQRLVAVLLERGDRLVAGAALSMLGDTCVPVIMGATAATSGDALPLLLWGSIVAAHEQGMRYCDLVAAPPSTAAARVAGDLGALRVSAPGPYEAAPSRLRGALAHGAEDVYRRLGRAA